MVTRNTPARPASPCCAKAIGAMMRIALWPSGIIVAVVVRARIGVCVVVVVVQQFVYACLRVHRMVG